MFIYIACAVVFIIIFPYYKKDANIIFPILILLLLNIFRGYSVGTDYENYYYHYLSSYFVSAIENFTFDSIYANTGMTNSYEVGWVFLNYIGEKLNVPFKFVNLLVALIVLSFVYNSIKQQSKYFYFSIYLYFMLYLFFPSFNIMRQSISISIFLYAIRYIQEGRILKYLSFCLFALLFHLSAIILPLMYLFKYIKLSISISICVVVLSFVIPTLGLDKVIISYILGSDILKVYSAYASIGTQNLNNIGIIMKQFLLIVPSVVFIYCCVKSNGVKNIYMTLWLIGIFIENITMNYGWLFRLGGYFSIVQILLFPMIVFGNNYDNKKEDSMVFLVVIIYSIIIFICKLYNGADGIVPYVV